MEALELMARNVLLFVLLALPGVILVKAKLLKGEQSGILSKLLLYIAMPFLIFKSALDLQLDRELLKTIIFSFILTLLYVFIWLWLSKPLSSMEKDEKKRGMMRFCMHFPNNGFLGIPLAMAVFPDKPLVITSLVAINVVTTTISCTTGAYLISADKSKISFKKVLFNSVLIAFLLGIVGNLLKLPTYIPETITYSQHLGGMVTPLSMLILGMKLGEVNFLSLFKSWKTYYLSAIKLLLSPVLIVALAFLTQVIFHTNDELIFGMFISFAMPTAALATTFADSYGGDVQGGVSYTLGSTVLSIATIPLLYWGLCALL